MVLVVVVIHLRLLVTEMKMAKDYNEGVYTNFVSARYVFFFFFFFHTFLHIIICINSTILRSLNFYRLISQISAFLSFLFSQFYLPILDNFIFLIIVFYFISALFLGSAGSFY